MKQLTCTSLLLALTLLFGVQSTMADTLDNQDLAFAFGSDTTLAMQTLSEQEMVETEGAYGVPGAVVGGLWGGITYGWNSAINNNFSWSGLAWASGSGAVLGAIAGPVPVVRTIWGTNASNLVGAGSGVGSYNGLW